MPFMGAPNPTPQAQPQRPAATPAGVLQAFGQGPVRPQPRLTGQPSNLPNTKQDRLDRAGEQLGGAIERGIERGSQKKEQLRQEGRQDKMIGEQRAREDQLLLQAQQREDAKNAFLQKYEAEQKAMAAGYQAEAEKLARFERMADAYVMEAEAAFNKAMTSAAVTPEQRQAAQMNVMWVREWRNSIAENYLSEQRYTLTQHAMGNLRKLGGVLPGQTFPVWSPPTQGTAPGGPGLDPAIVRTIAGGGYDPLPGTPLEFDPDVMGAETSLNQSIEESLNPRRPE